MQAVSWMEKCTPLDISQGQMIASDAPAPKTKYLAAPCKSELTGSIIAHRKTTGFHLLGINGSLKAQERLSLPLTEG